MSPSQEGDQPIPSQKKPAKKRHLKASVDLIAASEHVHFETRELREKLESRLRREEKAAEHETWKDKLILVFTLVALAVVASSYLVLNFRAGPSEDRKGAMAILASIVSIGVGYIGSRASKPS